MTTRRRGEHDSLRVLAARGCLLVDRLFCNSSCYYADDYHGCILSKVPSRLLASKEQQIEANNLSRAEASKRLAAAIEEEMIKEIAME